MDELAGVHFYEDTLREILPLRPGIFLAALATFDVAHDGAEVALPRFDSIADLNGSAVCVFHLSSVGAIPAHQVEFALFDDIMAKALDA